MRLAKFLGALGRICISTGVLILLFVAYQLWGTGIQTAQAQDDLKQDFTTILDNSASTTTLPPGAPSPPPARPIEPTVPGDPMALIVIPKIGVDNIVVEGVSLSNLKKGPGHYPDSPVPGQKGNAAIAGHRTTYGAPFNRLDELTPGDEILVTTVQGRFRYIVSDEDGDGNGNQIVLPSQVEVLQDFGDNRLTLTACHPKYSARQPRQHRRRESVGPAGRPARPAGLGHLVGGLDPGPPLAARAGLRDRPAVLSGRTLLLLRAIQPTVAVELLTLSDRGTPPGASPGRRRSPPPDRDCPTPLTRPPRWQDPRGGQPESRAG